MDSSQWQRVQVSFWFSIVASCCLFLLSHLFNCKYVFCMPSRKNQDALALFFLFVRRHPSKKMISWEQFFDILHQTISLPNRKSTQVGVPLTHYSNGAIFSPSLFPFQDQKRHYFLSWARASTPKTGPKKTADLELIIIGGQRVSYWTAFHCCCLDFCSR